MNQFQSISSGAGLLKDFYEGGDRVPQSPMASALRRRRQQLSQSRLGGEDKQTGLVDQFSEDDDIYKKERI